MNIDGSAAVDIVGTMNIPRGAFAYYVTKLRRERAISQTELASISGISASALSHYENGRRAPGLTNLIRIANALDVSTDRLLGRGAEHESLAPFRRILLDDGGNTINPPRLDSGRQDVAGEHPDPDCPACAGGGTLENGADCACCFS